MADLQNLNSQLAPEQQRLTMKSRSETDLGQGQKQVGPIQIHSRGCLLGELIVSNEDRHWCEALYQSKAADLVLYGRALGLSHCEAEDVLQETFIALMALDSEPRQPIYYCLRSFRNRALNYRRSLWRRLSRELESSRWFERSEG